MLETLQSYLQEQQIPEGKMFGVLLVKNQNGIEGEIWGYSGNIIQEINNTYFVPPIYDINKKGSFFKQEENLITIINKKIEHLENSPKYKDTKLALEKYSKESKEELTILKEKIKKDKIKRDETRKHSNLTPIQKQELIKQSQFNKAEYKRLESKIKEHSKELEYLFLEASKEIENLKKERKIKSAQLQNWIFEQFQLLNAQKQIKNLKEIFIQTPLKTPPAGAGECAAPRLFQYAYSNNLIPIKLIEFWWGESPKSQIRIHKNTYPPCKGKCGPILDYMLNGLDNKGELLIKNNYQNNFSLQSKIEIIYQDEQIIAVNKPEGLLSVPGKEGVSLQEILIEKYKGKFTPLSIHRLDMHTSGIILFAKNKEAHYKYQKSFLDKTISKTYVAILDGSLKDKMGEQYTEIGEINIPLAPDYINRPMQKVDYDNGKTAITHFKVIQIIDKYTIIKLQPITGRTHQLRVHCAHPDGLGIPILGEQLYGKQAQRLFLHSESKIGRAHV